MSLKVLVLPIFRRYWLYHAWLEVDAVRAASTAVAHNAGPLDGRLQQVKQWLTLKAQDFARKTWRDLESSKDGTLKNRIYRFAQATLAREDPAETFLKTVPATAEALELIYPASLQEKLVRRRLRLLLKQRMGLHKWRLAGWSAALIPQLPVLITPFPNVLVYYTLYRMASHYGAWRGGRTLQSGLKQLEQQQLARLHLYLLQLQRSGHTFEPNSWTYKLLHQDNRHRDLLSRMEAVAPETLGFQNAPTGLQVKFSPHQEVEALVQPKERLKAPLGDEAALHLAELFKQEHLLEFVTRARRRATGSPFPQFFA